MKKQKVDEIVAAYLHPHKTIFEKAAADLHEFHQVMSRPGVELSESQRHQIAKAVILSAHHSFKK